MRVATIKYLTWVQKEESCICAHGLLHLESMNDVESSDDPDDFEEKQKSKKQSFAEKAKRFNLQGFHVDDGTDNEVLDGNEDTAIELQGDERLTERDDTDDQQGKRV